MAVEYHLNSQQVYMNVENEMKIVCGKLWLTELCGHEWVKVMKVIITYYRYYEDLLIFASEETAITLCFMV